MFSPGIPLILSDGFSEEHVMGSKDDQHKEAIELCRQAEVTSKGKAIQPPENSGAPATDVLKMLRELRIHQNELEMQNKALRKNLEKQVAARAWYFDLYDLAPVGYCILSEKGLILEGNLAAATLLGTTRSELVNQPFARFIRKADQSIYDHHRKKLFETGMPHDCELKMLRSDRALFRVKLNSTTTKNAKGTPTYLSVIIDITGHRQADGDPGQSRNLSAISLLVADISHEINNPNGFIIFNLPILRDYLQELMPIVDRHMKKYPKQELFGRFYADFRKDLFDLLDNIEHGAQRIDAAVSKLKAFSRKQEKPSAELT